MISPAVRMGNDRVRAKLTTFWRDAGVAERDRLESD